jgi:hypothetical protein
LTWYVLIGLSGLCILWTGSSAVQVDAFIDRRGTRANFNSNSRTYEVSGAGGQTTQHVYRTNKATAITSDVPSEAELTPKLWGK